MARRNSPNVIVAAAGPRSLRIPALVSLIDVNVHYGRTAHLVRAPPVTSQDGPAERKLGGAAESTVASGLEHVMKCKPPRTASRPIPRPGPNTCEPSVPERSRTC